MHLCQKWIKSGKYFRSLLYYTILSLRITNITIFELPVDFMPYIFVNTGENVLFLIIMRPDVKNIVVEIGSVKF